MLALALAVFLLLAFVRALRARHVAAAGIAAEAYLLAMDGANGLAEKHADGNVFEGLIVVFLGPSASMTRGAGALRTTAWFVEHPMLVHVLAMGWAVAIVALLRRQVAPLRPESGRARALDAIALPLVFVAAMEATQLVIAGALSWLLAD